MNVESCFSFDQVNSSEIFRFGTEFVCISYQVSESVRLPSRWIRLGRVVPEHAEISNHGLSLVQVTSSPLPESNKILTLSGKANYKAKYGS